jgi:hypothetical protein
MLKSLILKVLCGKKPAIMTICHHLSWFSHVKMHVRIRPLLIDKGGKGFPPLSKSLTPFEGMSPLYYDEN